MSRRRIRSRCPLASLVLLMLANLLLPTSWYAYISIYLYISAALLLLLLLILFGFCLQILSGNKLKLFCCNCGTYSHFALPDVCLIVGAIGAPNASKSARTSFMVYQLLFSPRLNLVVFMSLNEVGDMLKQFA